MKESALLLAHVYRPSALKKRQIRRVNEISLVLHADVDGRVHAVVGVEGAGFGASWHMN